MSGVAGWYSDPYRPGHERWFDGQQWTDWWQLSGTAAQGLAVPAMVHTGGVAAAPNAHYAYQRPGPNGAVVAIAWIVAVVTLLYMLPWAVAATANSRNQVAVFVVNLLLGWTFVGWIAALVIAIATPRESTPVMVQQANPTVHVHLPPGSWPLGPPNPGPVPPVGF
jgi:hypothetical protein